MYNGALADMGLTTDSFTGNRYAFGAGNPVNRIELDGHEPCRSNCNYTYTGDPAQDAESHRFVDEFDRAQPDRDTGRRSLNPDGTRASAAAYDANGGELHYDNTFFTGIQNPGLGETESWDTHIEPRVIRDFGKRGLLKKGNTIVIAVDKKRAPCDSRCAQGLERVAKRYKLTIIYRAPGLEDNLFGGEHSSWDLPDPRRRGRRGPGGGGNSIIDMLPWIVLCGKDPAYRVGEDRNGDGKPDGSGPI